ncbi:hypothetical protein RJ639_001593 [Escallonia herrerae]|uniref:Chaperone DnaJ C-terminal domain-containing protein n=1 Tax=Escallonia herrerae TaxID=1293975 RepID=A0AA88XFH8_9ASTE|nr:hypothetical protein RJ639_001593 [Escallonia herrerae]
MEKHSRSPSEQDLCGMLGIGSVCRACKSLVTKRHPEKNSSPRKLHTRKDPYNNKLKSADESYKAFSSEVRDAKTMNDVHNTRYIGEAMHGDDPSSPRGFFMHRTLNHYFTSSPLSSPCPSPTPLSRSTSRRSRTPTPSRPAPSLLKTMSRRSVDATSFSGPLSRSASRRSSTIMYSNSNGLIKPPATEKQLECTLEELCLGCIKKIKIRRDVVTNNGQIVQEEEVLTIKVKPGWTKGTKITFEGMGNETPGTYPADITFVVAEKRHPLFRREGEDLELAIEIPLLKALTGCTLSIPLVGGEQMSLTLDDIIYPGCEKIIAGQGMPMPKEQGKRGNLIVKFLVEFPEELTEYQRYEIHSILKDSC